MCHLVSKRQSYHTNNEDHNICCNNKEEMFGSAYSCEGISQTCYFSSSIYIIVDLTTIELCASRERNRAEAFDLRLWLDFSYELSCDLKVKC